MGKSRRIKQKRESEEKVKNHLSSLKEIIYIDEVELNSILAQIQSGLPTVIQAIRQVTKGSSKESKSSSSKTAELGLPKMASGGFQSQNSDSINSIHQQMTQTAISTVYNDYALEIVEKKLEDSGLIANRISSSEGNILKLNSNFKIYNFEEIKETLSSEGFLKVLSMSQENNEDTTNIIQQLKSVIDVINSVSHGANIVSLNGAAALAKKNCFRMNSAQLQMLQNRHSKITVLGIVESIITPEISSANVFAQEASNNLGAIGKLTATMNLSLMTSLGLIKENDRLIKPIAIYFE